MTAIRRQQAIGLVLGEQSFSPTTLAEFDTWLGAGTGGYVVITPKLATDILEKYNHGNRKRNEIKVQQYRRDMVADRWMADGEIGFGIIDGIGQLGDGQHRLCAQIESGTTQRYRARVFTDSDQFALYVGAAAVGGHPRTLADLLLIFGISENSGAASQFERVANAMHGFSGASEGPVGRLSRQERMDYAIQHKASIAYVLTLPRRQFKAHVLAAIALAYEKKPTQVKAFVERVVKGADLAAGSPELELSKHLPDLNAARNAAAKDHAMGQVIRVLHDVSLGRGRTTILRARVDSIREAIGALVSKAAADMWEKRQKARKG